LHTVTQKNSPGLSRGCEKKAFDHDVTALAAGKRVALSNFVLIPTKKI
jgi:hypothetical protein